MSNGIDKPEEYYEPDYPDLAAQRAYKLEEVKRHVVQLEAITLGTIFFVSLVFLQPAVSRILGQDAAFLLPFPFLAAVAWLAPVVNPGDSIRARIKWGLAGLGAGATVGGTVAGAFSLGIAAPVGAAIGGCIGFVTGVVAGPAMDGTGKPILTQGQAREYLMEKRKKYPDLDFQQVIDATAYPPTKTIQPIPMFVSDGTIKCAKEDVDAWLKKKPWK
jgi:hypothetical protein